MNVKILKMKFQVVSLKEKLASKRNIFQSVSDEDCIELELQNSDECEDFEEEISGSETEKENRR
jgi:hypothetical protein